MSDRLRTETYDPTNAAGNCPPDPVVGRDTWDADGNVTERARNLGAPNESIVTITVVETAQVCLP